MSAATTLLEKDGHGLGFAELLLLPFVLFLAAVREVFAGDAARLRARRRSGLPPQAWQEAWPALRLGEWSLHDLLARGTRQILATDKLDLSTLRTVLTPPEDFQPAMPRSALAMHLRVERIARFMADPERYIRRHVRRIARREAARAAGAMAGLASAAAPDSGSRRIDRAPAPGCARSRFARRARAPPWFPARRARAPPWFPESKELAPAPPAGFRLRECGRTHCCGV